MPRRLTFSNVTSRLEANVPRHSRAASSLRELFYQSPENPLVAGSYNTCRFFERFYPPLASDQTLRNKTRWTSTAGVKLGKRAKAMPKQRLSGTRLFTANFEKGITLIVMDD